MMCNMEAILLMSTYQRFSERMQYFQCVSNQSTLLIKIMTKSWTKQSPFQNDIFFSHIMYWLKYWYFHSNFTKVCSWGSNEQYVCMYWFRRWLDKRHDTDWTQFVTFPVADDSLAPINVLNARLYPITTFSMHRAVLMSIRSFTIFAYFVLLEYDRKTSLWT